MKKIALTAVVLIALGGIAQAQAPTTTTTTTTTETPAGMTTTTTDVTAPAPAPVAPAPQPTARDAITGERVDPSSVNEKRSDSLRDRVRNKIKDEASVKQ